MCAPNTITDLQDLKGFIPDENTGELIDKSTFRNYSTDVAFTIGYLLGVREEYLEKIPQEESKYNKLRDKLDGNENARAIRVLNNIRSNLMLLFKKVSNTIRVTSADFKPLYMMDEFKDDFKALRRLNIEIATGRSDINEYLEIINNEILKRINNIKNLFPDWVEFKHIRYMFQMPSNIKPESEKFQSHQDSYPFKRYFYWENPRPEGNILYSDEKILTIIYENNGDFFRDISKVKDASDNVKQNISDFISRGERTQIFIDGENVDPYRFAAAMDSLKDHEIDKIDKITVYYDNTYSNRAWTMLKHFTYDVEVEAIGVDRIKEDKSLVDHKLVAGVSKAVYKEGIDSVIIASSDSDFWSVIEDVEADYLVMVEKDKCGHNFRDVLKENNVFYCYLDTFMTPEDNSFFKLVFKKELENIISASFALGDAHNLLDDVILSCRAELSDAEKESMYNKYIKGLTLTVNKEGIFEIKIPE